MWLQNQKAVKEKWLRLQTSTFWVRISLFNVCVLVIITYDCALIGLDADFNQEELDKFCESIIHDLEERTKRLNIHESTVLLIQIHIHPI